MIVHFLLYTIALVFVSVAVLGVAQDAKRRHIPVALACCVMGGFILYWGSLLPGIVHLFTPWAVTGGLVVLSLIVFVLFFPPGSPWWRQPEVMSSSKDQARPLADPRGERAVAVCVVLGVVCLEPLTAYVLQVPELLFSRNLKLPWDVVSYHLPVYVHFVQERSLWPLKMPFQSYAFGYELIGGLPSLYFFSHWGFALANTYSIVFLLAALYVVIRHLQGSAGLPMYHALTMSIFLMSAGLWSLLFRHAVFSVGKNDIFMTACLFAALGLMFEHSSTGGGEEGLRRRSWLAGLAMLALGLAVGAKPSALMYVPLFALMAWSSTGPSPGEKRPVGPGLQAAAVMTGGGLIIGGFWYVRNYLAFGHIMDPALAEGFAYSLVANLRNPDLYHLREGALMVGLWAVAASGIPLLLLRQVRGAPRGPRPPVWMLLFHLHTLVAFAVTPWVLFNYQKTWDLRLGMPLFTSAVILTVLWGVLQVYAAQNKRLTRTFRGLAGAAILCVLLALPLWWERRPYRGLPGYETLGNLPRTSVYTWIQALRKPVRIYAAGLRPYGLYGAGWQNKVLYDLHSNALENQLSEKIRLLAIMRDFRPDLIIIAVDPLRSATREKPGIVTWLRSEPCFAEVFNDEIASVFEVAPGWEELLKTFSVPDSPIRMRS